MPVRISRRLNLVIPVDTLDGSTLYVHHTPISREVFEKYFLVLSKTFARVYQEGLNVFSGPRVSALLLRKIAEDTGTWDGPDGVENGLMAEIRRLTNVAVGQGAWGKDASGEPAPQGWQSTPYEDALKQKLLDPDDISEVDNAICFFTVASYGHHRSQLPAIYDGMTSLWGALTTSSNSTEWKNSLATSIEEESSGETESTSSVPS